MKKAEMEEVIRIFNECQDEKTKKEKMNFVLWYESEVEPLNKKMDEMSVMIKNYEKAIAELKARAMKAEQDALFQRQRAQLLMRKLNAYREKHTSY